MIHIRLLGAAAAGAALCAAAACQHQMRTSTMGGTVAPGGSSYDVQVWTGNKRSDVPFPTQRVAMSLRWAESDEGLASWNEGFASNTQARQTVRVDHPHGMLRAVRVTLDGDPNQTGPALLVDSVGVTSAASGVRYVCVNNGTSATASIRPGASSDLHCRKE